MRLIRPLVLGLAIAASLLLWLQRSRPLRRIAEAQPATSYDEAQLRLARLQTTDLVHVNPLCRTQFLSHARRTERVFILLHGFTNCPHQFDQFARLLYESGANVLNVRLPRHGLADPLTDQLAYLTAEEMVAQTCEVIDLAHGFAEHVTLFGFSLGGTLAGWAAHQRPDLDRAVLASPAIGIRAITQGRSRLLANLLAWAPNTFRWWDPVAQANRQGPGHAYPRFATRGLAELLRLGNLVRAAAQQEAPVVADILVITNPCDEVVDNAATAAMVTAWQRQGAQVRTLAFPASWRLIHDLIDPSQPHQQVARVYPLLLRWLTEPLA